MFQHLQQLIPDAGERLLMIFGGSVGGVVSFAFGGDKAVLLCWLFIFVFIDSITGNIGALRTGTWRSKTFGLGVTKKVLYFGMVALSHGLDKTFEPILHFEIMQNVVICAYTAGEFGSIIENLERCGLGSIVPPVIRRMVAALNERVDTTVDKISGKEK